MKVAILAGGSGTRMAELTEFRPKPLVEIGDRPILWHLLQYCSCFGLQDFVIALGYKGEMIKRYIVDLCALSGDLQVDFHTGHVARRTENSVSWRIDLVDTGAGTQTGGRIKRLSPYLATETFLLLWSDGLFDVDLSRVIAFHRHHGRLATMVVVSPPSRFGHTQLDGDQVTAFVEKPIADPAAGADWINAGIFVLEPGIVDYIEGDQTAWERRPLEHLAQDGQLFAYRHTSFWQCMDTVAEQQALDERWQRNDAPWKIWV